MANPRLLLLLLLAGLEVVTSDNSVQFVSSYRQKVTSSTLNWASAESGRVPEFAVVGATEIVPGELVN